MTLCLCIAPALTFSQKKQHINFPSHGKTIGVTHFQAGQHLIFIAPPAAHLPSDLHRAGSRRSW